MSEYPVYAPLVTPFTPADTVDVDALASLVDSVESRGVDGVVPCGTTGEFASLADEEYGRVVEATVDAASGTVVTGVSDTSVAGVRSKVALATDAGCDAVLLTGPYFHTENATGGTEAFLREAVADAPVPVYLYNLPAYVGVRLEPATVRSLAEDRVIDGIKDSSGDVEYLLTLVRATPPEFEVFCGYDSVLVPALTGGITGGINALANVVPEVFDVTTSALADGDVERAVRLSQAAIAPLFEQCSTHGFAPATKAGAAARGFIDSTAVRPPLVDLDDGAQEDVAAAVEDALTVVDTS
ncbi:dihydrodipicolinate synthase family protein [Salinigranum rubrum]|uniref:Dihydrodipicolinate synthase family protein n=1 Tax=Salinigranum rubrum TaxID=755307 RepID=A0A2I8VIF9_9EURY|nr:dihydrodipicolinate synthase family protein [Salinigranum rubrum]AUV81723.1 dihydrodipicolinate synthase family protein [Salinigranum rubrum]